MPAQKVASTKATRVAGAAGDVNAPASNTDAVATLSADAANFNVISSVEWSYSATPAAGTYVKIEDGSGNIVRKWYVTNAGPGQIKFDPPLANAAINTALIVTAKAGGAGVSGTVEFGGAWLEQP